MSLKERARERERNKKKINKYLKVEFTFDWLTDMCVHIIYI